MAARRQRRAGRPLGPSGWRWLPAASGARDRITWCAVTLRPRGAIVPRVNALATPPHPNLPTARRTGGDDGVRALLAWVAATFPPPRHTLTDAARALGATTPEQARTVARSIHRAAARVGLTLPMYPAGCPRGSAAWERMVATRAARAGQPRARKRSPAEMDAARRAHDAEVKRRREERAGKVRRKQREF